MVAPRTEDAVATRTMVLVSDITDWGQHSLDDGTVSEDVVGELTVDMRQSGYDDRAPVILAGYDDTKGADLRIVNGRHRVLAARAAGIEVIPAVVLSWPMLEQLERQYPDHEEIERAVLAGEVEVTS